MRYEFSHQPLGPFMAFKHYESPQSALDMARASFDGTVYIAQMDELLLKDIFPPDEVMWGELMERVTERYGFNIAMNLEDANGQAIREAYNRMLGQHYDVVTEAIYVPVAIVECQRDKQTINAGEFKRGRKVALPKQLSLKELL